MTIILIIAITRTTIAIGLVLHYLLVLLKKVFIKMDGLSGKRLESIAEYAKKQGKKVGKRQRRRESSADVVGKVAGLFIVVYFMGILALQIGFAVVWLAVLGGCLLLWIFIRDDVKKKKSLPEHKGFTISLFGFFPDFVINTSFKFIPHILNISYNLS